MATKSQAGYCNKYDPYNDGTRFVFGYFYTLLNNLGVKSNVVAVCGENIEEYIKYAFTIATTNKSRIYFVEKDFRRYKRLIRKAKNMKRLKVLYGNVLTYEDLPGCHLKFSARVEDMGIGLRFDKMVYRMIGRLDEQKQQNQDGCRALKYKAQIFDGSRRYVSNKKAFASLQEYLKVVGSEIKSINGFHANSKNIKSMFAKGTQVLRFINKKGKISCVRGHHVKFKKRGKIVDFRLFTHTNGSSMITSILVYK